MNMIKSSYSTMPNVVSLINKSNVKKLRNNQRTDPLNAIVLIQLIDSSRRRVKLSV